MSNPWPSSGGIAMILTKAYGPGAVAAAASLLMALSMVINESLVARTFATYALRPFDIENGPLVSVIGVGLIIFAYLVNASGNRSVGLLSVLMSALKIGGIALAMVATASGLIASVFAVSRMLAMLTDMEMIPHSHFGMSGTIQSHTLVYTVVIAGALTVLFDLSRIASLGAFFYLVMDMLVHWGVWRRLRHEIGARGSILLTALVLDAVVLAAFALIKWRSDPAILWIAAGGIALVFSYERVFLKRWLAESKSKQS
jgi:amino acid transporter